MTVASALLVLLLGLLSFGLCVGALALRRSQGFAPLMLVVGVLEGVKYHLTSGLWLDMPGGGMVSVGSLVSYINLLAVMLVVHLIAGVAAARAMAWGVIGLSVTLGVVHGFVLLLAAQPGVELQVPGLLQHLASGVRIQSVGNILLLIGLLGSVLLFEWLRQRGLGLLLALVLTLQIVVQLDTPLFLFLAYGPEKLEPAMLLAQAAGKGAMAIVFAGLAWLVLCRESVERFPVLARGRIRSLLGAYAFQQSRLELLERELQTDPLTGAFNRRYLERTVPDILQLDRRRGDPSSLLLLDLDHFKAVNDRHGHLVGDRVLRHVAEILREALRRQDSVIRYGGEEFILLLPGTGLEAARSVAEGLLENLGQRPLRLDDGDLVAIGATIGVAVSPTDGSTWQAVLACADERMYAGKRKGRGRVVAASTATAGPM